MKRMVIGSSGSGKSTFSTKLAHQLNDPVLHLDSLWHATDYSKEALEWFIQEQKNFMEQEAWIIDGNYRRTIPVRMEQVDQIIWLKVTKVTAIFRVLRRSIRYRFNRKSRQEMPDQFQEKFDREYWEFLRFVWNFDNDSLAEMIRSNKKSETKLVVLKTKRQKEQFLKECLLKSVD